MRRIVFLLPVLCMLIAICGCQYSVDINDKGTFTEGIEESLSDDETETDYALTDGTTVESETIVDADGVIVRVLGLENSTELPRLQMVFDKGNNESIDFVADYVIVDGWQVTGMVFPTSDYGLIFRNCAREYSKFTGYLSISTGLLVECGLLDQIHEIEFGYKLLGRIDSILITEGVYSATTSNGEEKSDDFICDGPVLLDKDGIKIQIYSFEHGEYMGEDCEKLFVYIENNSDHRIEVIMDDGRKYDNTESDDEEKTETTGSVVPRVDNKSHSVPLGNELDVCAGLRALSGLQTADDSGNSVSLSDEEVLSFSLKIYDYEEYDPYDPPNPLYDEKVTLTTENMFTPG
ncbi:MAG: hypothetical protein LUD72_00540 [Bacteroidales bacterium]|nr:hypothetical protein [Bacteroidales bacterium]